MTSNYSWFFEEDYFEEAHLGRGGFGTVHRVDVGGEAFAIKKVRDRYAYIELRNQQSLDHPSILKCFAGRKERSGHFAFLLEYAPLGSLQSVLDKYGYVERGTAYGFYSQILSALKHMHSKKLCHWDLHSGNVLVFSTKLVKLCDFGCTRTMSTDLEVRRHGYRGPPEALDRDTENGVELDLWCAALLYLRSLIGKRPWHRTADCILYKVYRSIVWPIPFFHKNLLFSSQASSTPEEASWARRSSWCQTTVFRLPYRSHSLLFPVEGRREQRYTGVQFLVGLLPSSVMFLVVVLCVVIFLEHSSATIRAKRYYDFTLTIPGKVINVSGKHPLITLMELVPWVVSGAPRDKFPFLPGNTLPWIPRFGSQPTYSL
uniref:Protein kinase domain-containing protein n=1 Tax=Steinernema glaseri TaxID=37863 RepID=A0A1I7ZYI8_9BILA